MRPDEIDLFDGHCDFVFMSYLSGRPLGRNEGPVDLERGRMYRRYAQFFALFGYPEQYPGFDLRGLDPAQIFRGEYSLFCREIAANGERIAHCRAAGEAEAAFEAGKMAAFLSVEGAELLGCSLEGLEEAHRLGVRAVNLTWNHANTLSGSNKEEPDRGLTARGRAFVGRMGELGMLVDVSHLSDPGFWDVAELLPGPFIASHSNSRSVFFHPRNLTDEQFTAIMEHNGVAGLNLYANFLGERPGVDTAIAHLEHWLDLGGAANVALGADFDGCDTLPEGIRGVQDMERIWNRMAQRNYSTALLRALFFDNLMRVVREVCIM